MLIPMRHKTSPTWKKCTKMSEKINNDVVENIKDYADNMSGRPHRSEKARKRKEYSPSFRGKSYAQLMQMVKKEGKVDGKEMYRRAVNVIFAQAEETTEAPGVTGGP